MNKKYEAFKLEFLTQLEDSDYKLIHDYPNIQTCVDVICLRDLISRKSRFKIFKLKGIDRLFVKVDSRILVDYAIFQNGNVFELLEMSLEKYDKLERLVNKM